MNTEVPNLSYVWIINETGNFYEMSTTKTIFNSFYAWQQMFIALVT